MSEPFIGEIKMAGFAYAPCGFAFCDGQLLPIDQNEALFSLLYTTYGGDGRTTFALPDLQGRVPMHQGAGPGLTPRTMGEKGGSETVPFIRDNLGKAGGTVDVVEGARPDPSNLMPCLTVAFVIALYGVYPVRE